MPYYVAEIRFNRKSKNQKRERRMRKRLIMRLAALLFALALVSTLVMIVPAAVGSKHSDQSDTIISLLEQLAGNVSLLTCEDFEQKIEESAEGRKGAFLNKISAVVNQIEAGSYEGALNKLKNDIKNKILEWIDDESEMKKILIDLVDKIISIIEGVPPVDSEPPVIHAVWRDPEKPEYEYNETVTVKALVTDEGTGVEHVILYYWNGTAFENVTMVGEEPLYTGTIHPLPYGTMVEYWVKASDYAENWRFSDEYFYTVTDTYLPTVRIDYPSEGSYLAGQVNISVYAYDDNFVSANLTIDDELVSSWTSAGTHTYNWNTTTPDYPDGTYTIKLTAYDIASNNRSEEIIVTVDNTPPLVIVNAPAEGSYLKDIVIVDVAGTDDNFDKMELYIGDTLVETWTKSGSHLYGWNTTAYPDGSYTITLKVYDKAGNMNETAVTVTVDNTPPTASIIGPLEGSFLKGSVSVDVSGDDDNFDKMELYVDVVLVANFSVGGVQTYVWDTPDTERAYSITLKVYDKAGSSATDEITVIVDNIVPTAEIKKPVKDAYLRGTYDLVIYGHDTNLNRTELYVDEAFTKTWNVSGTIIYAWDTTPFDDGSYTIKLIVHDKAGNIVEKTVTVTVDNTPPSIETPTWDPEEPLADEEVNVSVTIHELVSGLKNVTLRYRTDDEWKPIEMTLTNVNWTATIPGQNEDVSVKFYIEAYDNAGNRAETETYEYTVKAPAPLPLAFIAAIGLAIAALSATLLYALYRRRKRGRSAANPGNKPKPTVTLYVPANILSR
ncbi:MAG: Ig-like domain-containing protein [Candidatus Bathyarchaeia archaeon]